MTKTSVISISTKQEKLPFCPRVFMLVGRDARRKYVIYGHYRIDFGGRWHNLYGVQPVCRGTKSEIRPGR